MTPDLLKALQSLDPNNDDHWTSDNLPKLDVLKLALGRDITRSELTKTSKGFSRKNLTLPRATDEAAAIGTPASIAEVSDASASTAADIAAALTSADAAVAAAEKIRKAAYDAMTEVAGARLVRTTAEQAQDIKAFQTAQRLQRESENEQTKLFAKVLSSQTPQPK